MIIRDDFEKHFSGVYGMAKDSLNQYVNADTLAAWDGWQAARAQGGEAEVYLPFGAGSAYADAKEAGKDNMTISCELVVEMVDALEQSHQENEALRKANTDCVAWEKACKADLDRALARVAELEALNEKLAASLKEKMIFAEGAWVLRKQAEAVEECASYFGGRDFVDVKFIISEHAKRLNSQADELEKSGGDDA